MDDHEWPVVDSETEYETGWYDGGYDRVEQPDGTEKSYYWVSLPPAVVVVAVHDGDVLFVDQYRPTIREQCLELVAGIVEESAAEPEGQAPDEGRESYVAAAARELREETGYEAEEIHFLQEFYTATGVLRHKRGIVYAEGLTEVGQELGDNEFLTVKRIPVEDAVHAARELPANDATIEGLLLAKADGYL